MPTQSAGSTLANSVVTGTTETAACMSPFLTDALPHAGGLLIQGFVNLTPGAGMTTAQLTVRQGSGTGGAIVVQQQPVTVVAGAPIDMPFYGIDGAPPGGSQYTVTVTQAGGAGNGTLNQALITVDEVLAGLCHAVIPTSRAIARVVSYGHGGDFGDSRAGDHGRVGGAEFPGGAAAVDHDYRPVRR